MADDIEKSIYNNILGGIEKFSKHEDLTIEEMRDLAGVFIHLKVNFNQAVTISVGEDNGK